MLYLGMVEPDEPVEAVELVLGFEDVALDELVLGFEDVALDELVPCLEDVFVVDDGLDDEVLLGLLGVLPVGRLTSFGSSVPPISPELPFETVICDELPSDDVFEDEPKLLK